RLERRHILVDYRIVKFLTGFQYGVSEKKMPLEEKMAVIERAIAEKGALSI
ncbi:MAG: hypothetical protein HY542_00695, partial [Deltaproteobacteria bacterium]|nr:hypothetical protein [Deltaproteobacteria bacterium]